MNKKKMYGVVKAALIQAEQDGLTFDEVCSKYGFKQRTVRDLCAKYGIVLRLTKTRRKDYATLLKEFQQAEDRYIKLVSLAVENSWDGKPERSPSNQHIRSARLMAEDAACKLREAAKIIGRADLIKATEYTLGKNGF